MVRGYDRGCIDRIATTQDFGFHSTRLSGTVLSEKNDMKNKQEEREVRS